MKNYILVIIALLLFSCGGQKKGPDLSPESNRKTMSGIPEWYLDSPVKEGFRYASNTATSQDLQLAMDKATLGAATKLAATIESEMEAFTKRIQEEKGLGSESDVLGRFSKVQSQIVATSLKDYSVAKKLIQEEKSNTQNIYRVYVLIEWDEGAANQRTLDRIKADKEIYDALRESELIEEMEAKVESYRKRKG